MLCSDSLLNHPPPQGFIQERSIPLSQLTNTDANTHTETHSFPTNKHTSAHTHRHIPMDISWMQMDVSIKRHARNMKTSFLRLIQHKNGGPAICIGESPLVQTQSGYQLPWQQLSTACGERERERDTHI